MQRKPGAAIEAVLWYQTVVLGPTTVPKIDGKDREGVLCMPTAGPANAHQFGAIITVRADLFHDYKGYYLQPPECAARRGTATIGSTAAWMIMSTCRPPYGDAEVESALSHIRR